ncbi:PREDICTED: glycosyltransferase family protein 64 protein C5-like [Nicotiana attenuata]|uniref:Glucosamine inositolphosphorylceramide transferase 1 n=1 Tax=Nicotiana attenuata TaxID=49451 RepID=A0A1J6KV29_NICAT|nr:PREDICTED: glycosyltransferase family protein 64 protein C5-like [Nicotiana attenuata]OIT26619.1 glycosyltransferase family protein 64 protein c5 [Nicotiana attenuata]
MGSNPIVVSGSSTNRTTRPNNNKNKNNNDPCVSSSAFVFLIGSFIILGSICGLYVRFLMTPNVHAGLSAIGCKEDDEGSWSIGVFYGDSPFSLKPIEDTNIWRNESAAWPVANPVITCASASVAGFSSNFVADPFLYVQGDVLYMFFETKNSITMQGDIGVARSTDKGASWEQLGIALDEDWHLSYPYVFDYNGNIYMMPEGRAKGQLRLYRAVKFPMEWTLEKIIMKKPLVDSFIIPHDGKYWLFGSDHRGIGTEYNGQLEIWYSTSPLGPWKPHKKNPIYNTDKSMGARNGGRPFLFDGYLYRVGQDDGETYGRRIRLFKVEVLTTNVFKEVEVPLGLKASIKGRNAWNGARSHHLDVQRLSSGEWIGVTDGDRVPSGDASRRFNLGCASVLGVAALVILFGMLLGAVRGLVPLSWCPHDFGKRSDASLDWEQSNLISSRMRLFCSHLNRASSSLRTRIKPNTCSGSSVLALTFLVIVVLMCTGVKYIYGGSGAHEAYPLHGQYSQFTLLTMTYDARLWNLKMYVKHYSRCSSVREVVVVWNKGQPPELSEFDSAVPVRIRVEEKNSLNNRFKVDPSIKTRSVLELDDDIMMPCDDVERGFKVWREHPERIVGFYPRLANGSPLKYRAESHARKHNGYNMILTGAAFIDSKMAFEMYWSKEAAAGREIVDNLFNCEDVLLNFLYANASSSKTVEYVKPAWAIDTSKFSGVAISGNTQTHYALRSSCLEKFSEMYGSISNRKSEFNHRMDGWDV